MTRKGVRVKRVVALSTLFLSFSLLATVQEKTTCPDEIIGRLINMSDTPAQKRQRIRTNYDFQVIKSNKSDFPSGEIYTMKLLKFGPKKFSKGLVYKLSLRNGFLCNAVEYK